MLFSLSRTKGLLLAGALTLAGLVPHLAFAQAGAQGRPDATHVQMVSVPETYCRSIDNTDMTGQDYYFSAADVTAKSGKVIQSHNGGSCCTAAAPWNGSACQAVPTCTNDKDLVGWSCVATSDSCARVGMTLINGACGVAVPSQPAAFNPASLSGSRTRALMLTDGGTTAIWMNLETWRGKTELQYGLTKQADAYDFFISLSLPLDSSGFTKFITTSAECRNYEAQNACKYFNRYYGSGVKLQVASEGIYIVGSKRRDLLPWWNPRRPQPYWDAATVNGRRYSDIILPKGTSLY